MEIKRDSYLLQLQNFHYNGQLKIVTGVRRCGKSYLLRKIFRNWLLSHGVDDEHILVVDLEKKNGLKYRNPLLLSEFVERKVKHGKDRFYLFVDEVQLSDEVPNPWNPAGRKVTIYDILNEFREYENLDVYVTGSNSMMLSSDVLTQFRGRADEVRVHPLTFSEYFASVKKEKREALDEFMYFGGMPYLYSRADDAAKRDYLRKLFDEVYLKDIIERKGIERPEVLNYVLNLLCSSLGSLTNPNNIANLLKSQYGVDASVNTISAYIGYLKDAFLFSEVRRFDVKGRSYFDYPNKYYCEDVGLRNACTEWRHIEPTHLMECVVYNELIARGCAVDVGVVYARRKNETGNYVKVAKEIDFVVNDKGRRIYVQSAWMIGDAEKEKSEVEPFSLTGDSFRKILVRGDIGKAFYDACGNLNISLYDFLLHKDSLSTDYL